ncbi:hypothetical protein A1O3_00370 [Capronia epimyces CBS 606.96]|uniref:BRCT domain-containing protein n=1 Tax=Capronia epimyces CBS 606.96 TaxID=1182542 RepID=W9YQ75_9EURO|nr:uncharacterized protein A1O3_00370 [Capronia epimyces CBS 606.96]EXJ91820.1 hypothetical protein A1O3_00370 [Capronia epimyces CBS 606.96]
METESESLDISGLKCQVLQSLQSDSEDSQLIRQRQLDAIKAAYAKLPPIEPATRVTTVTTLPNSVPELASTVPDSQLQQPSDADLESQLDPLPPAHALSKAISIAQKMASQGSDTATQVLSPSHIQCILNSRSRSAKQQQDQVQDGDQEEGVETQLTLHEGDEGYIDIASSMLLQLEEAKEIDSDPVDFSPTQTQRALSQFPESQRFKTPATAGKKRRHNGDTVDSPALPRNPLLRGGADDDARVMGLSQAFAATQANTSPFVGDTHGDLRSDRPSPNIQQQPRPVTATNSSPMRPIVALFQRASTEPAARYISSKQSQAERERMAFMKQQERIADEEDDSDDGFDDEPSSVARDRRQRQIEQRRRATFQRLSSPPKGSGRGISQSKSSPIRSPTRGSPQSTHTARHVEIHGDSSTTRPVHGNPGNESEVETEQEDNDEVAVTRSSQGHGMSEDEDKENYSDSGSQIPETTARLIRVTTEFPSQVQDSPSLRRGRAVTGTEGSALPYSSEPFLVSDSQPSQPLRLRRGNHPTLKSIDIEADVDLVPQSPTASLQPARVPVMELAAEDSAFDRSDEKAAGAATDHALPGSSSHLHPGSTIPETSSDEQCQNSKGSTRPGEKQQSFDSRGQYETAQSRLPPSSSNPGPVDMSSPPIATTPPGRRRKLMAEIAAAPSPPKSQVSFSVNDALKLDPNFQSPLRKFATSHPMSVEEPRPAPAQSHPPERSQNAEEPHGLDPTESALHARGQRSTGPRALELKNTAPDCQVTSGLSSSTYPRQEKNSSPRLIATSESRAHAPHSTPRRSPWDLDASPPQKSVPVIKSSGLKRKAKDLERPQNKDKHALTKRLKTSGSVSVSKTNEEVSRGRQAAEDSHEVPELAASGEGQVSNTAKVAIPPVPDTIVAPNMVFACFNGKTRAYYPALCLGPSNAHNTRYLIQWEGYDPDEIDEYGIRSLDLRVGDLVKVNMEGFPKVSYVIRGFKDRVTKDNGKSRLDVITDRQGHKTLLVAPKQRKSLPTRLSTDIAKEVPVSAIYLDSNMWGQMRDRVYKYKAADLLSSPGISTPLERPSTPSSPPSRNRRNVANMIPSIPSASLPVAPLSEGVFANMAFAISYEDRSRKATLVELIEAHGGTVLRESFLDLLEPDSTGLQLKPHFAELSFTALLTERHSRKEKYMQALALGLPCLSGKWVEACIQSNCLVDWMTYLLPAGESAELDGATRSRLLTAASTAIQNTRNAEHSANMTVKVKDMIASRLDILGGSRVIMVIGKGKAEARRRPYLFLIRALGTGKIDLEPDVASAKIRLEDWRGSAGAEVEENGDGDCDDPIKWVFVDDRDASAARTMVSAFSSTSTPTPTPLSPSPSPSPSGIKANHKDKGKGKGKSRKKAKSRKNDSEHGQPDNDEPQAMPTFTPTPTPTPAVKVMCNEDIVQTLILGKLWMGGS